MEPLDFPEENKPVKPKATLADDKQLAFLNSAFGNLLIGSAIAGFSAIIIFAGDPSSTEIPFSFFTLFTGVVLMCAGIFRLFWEGLSKKDKRKQDPPL